MARPTIRQRFERHGFTLERTGGNCTAYVRTQPDGFREYVILSTDATAPSWMHDLCAVHACADGAPSDPAPAIARLDEVLRALEHPSDQYAALAFRIDAGLGRP